MGVGSAVTLGATVGEHSSAASRTLLTVVYFAFGHLTSLLLQSWMIQNGQPDRGHQVATATGVFLMGALPRAIKTRRFMPAGAVVAVGAAVALFNGKKAIEWEYGV